MSLHYPTAGGGDPGVEFAIDHAKLRDGVAADVAEEQTALLGVTQRPANEHVIMISQPQVVTDVILEALAGVGAPAAVA